MPRMLLTPLAWISLMMGRTLAANASAASLRAFMDDLRAAARRGPPSLTPRRLAACSAASPAAHPGAVCMRLSGFCLDRLSDLQEVPPDISSQRSAALETDS